MPTLRLLSVSTRSLHFERGGLARMITGAQPHLVCVHGAPGGLRWRNAAGALARACGLVVVSGGRLGGGNLILSALSVDQRATRDLRFGQSRAWSAPGATVAALRFHGCDFVLGAARLVGNAAERLDQVAELQAAVTGLVPRDVPAIVSAEGADRPGTSSWQRLTENRTAVAGGVFVDGRIDIGEAAELDRTATPFPPVRLDLSLTGYVAGPASEGP